MFIAETRISLLRNTVVKPYVSDPTLLTTTSVKPGRTFVCPTYNKK